MTKMKKLRIAAVLLICLSLVCLAAGCGKTNEPEDNFTLEEIERCNTADAIFKTCNSVRSETVFYNIILDSEKGERGDYTQTSVYVKDGGGVRAHTAFSDGYSFTIEKNWLCYSGGDGEYGINALFDDGYFEAYFEPYISKWLIFSPDEGGKFVSQTTKDGITTVIYRAHAEDMPDAEIQGLTEAPKPFSRLSVWTGKIKQQGYP